ncbi:MAG: RNA polymerase sigma factor [Acidobacteriaceae bacterium]|nr:RNA polymerase sigma factor [Acidobacteriaceae bacterium]
MERQLFDDRDFCKQITSGDTDDFDEWYRASAPRLHLFLKHLLGNEQAAEDVMQETYIQIWRRPQGFDPERGTLRAYLFGTARNLAISWKRKQRSTDELNHEPRVSDCVETNSMLSEALDRLDIDEQTILWLREVEGQSYSELSASLNIPIGTVRSRLYAAREALRSVWHNTQRNGRPQ